MQSKKLPDAVTKMTGKMLTAMNNFYGEARPLIADFAVRCANNLRIKTGTSEIN